MDDSGRGGDEGREWETDSDKLAGVPHRPRTGKQVSGAAPVGGLQLGNLTLRYHIHSLNTRAQILAILEQSAQNLITPKEKNQT